MKRIFQVNRKSTSYKSSVTRCVLAVLLIIIIIFTRCVLHFGFQNRILDELFGYALVVVLFGAIMCFYSSTSEISETYYNLKKQKKKNLKKVDFVVVKLDSIIKLLKSTDIIEFEALIKGKYCVFGTTSSSQADGPLMDKQYYIDQKKFDIKKEDEFITYFMEKIDSDTVNLISIDNIEASKLKKYGYNIKIV